jgi:hypothetical protein
VSVAPPTTKPLEKWTWEELKTYCAWEVVSGLLKGEALTSVMHRVCHMSNEWYRAREKK